MTNKEQILDKYKPPLKSNLLKSKIDRMNLSLKRILNNEDLTKKLQQYQKTLNLSKINIYDAIEAFKASDSCGFFNRHDFSEILLKMLKKFKAIDKYGYDKKNVDDTVNKLFSVLDKNVDGIVDMDEIIGISFLCSGSVGDRVKWLFEFFELDENGWLGYEELQKYFYSWFIIWFKGRNDYSFEIDIEQLSKATAENWVKYILEQKKEEICRENIINLRVQIDDFRNWVNWNVFKDFYKQPVEAM
jgi:Ca2+-binding EF-hand superfamily protein